MHLCIYIFKTYSRYIPFSTHYAFYTQHSHTLLAFCRFVKYIEKLEDLILLVVEENVVIITQLICLAANHGKKSREIVKMSTTSVVSFIFFHAISAHVDNMLMQMHNYITIIFVNRQLHE